MTRLLVHNDHANVQPLRLQNPLHFTLRQIHVREPRDLLLHPGRRLACCIRHLHAWRRSRVQDFEIFESPVLVDPDGVWVCGYCVCESEVDRQEESKAD